MTDTGTGIPKDIVDRIFDPFFTTKPIGQGTGLGLSMIHGFVRQSGGQIRVYTEEGHGTTMCLYLPRHVGEVGDDDAQAEAVGDDGRGRTVMVIDDEPIVRMLIVEVLAEAGYHVLEADDGPSGLRILQSSGAGGPPDHRCRPAWRPERPPGRRRGAPGPGRPEGCCSSRDSRRTPRSETVFWIPAWR